MSSSASRRKGQKSIDDFCHLFHGAPSTGPALKTYTFDDVVNALNQIAPTTGAASGPSASPTTARALRLGGIEGSGWKLAYDENPSKCSAAPAACITSFRPGTRLGLDLRDDGGISDTIEGEVAAKAGIGPGMKVVAVNGRTFSPEILREQSRRERTHVDDRTARRKRRLLQNVQARLSRRRNVSASGPRRIEAGLAERNSEGEVTRGRAALQRREEMSPVRLSQPSGRNKLSIAKHARL